MRALAFGTPLGLRARQLNDNTVALHFQLKIGIGRLHRRSLGTARCPRQRFGGDKDATVRVNRSFSFIRLTRYFFY